MTQQLSKLFSVNLIHKHSSIMWSSPPNIQNHQS